MPPKQTNTLTSFFSKGVKGTTTVPSATTVTTVTTVTATTKAETTAPSVTTETVELNADLRAFYASLSPPERIAHAIAETDLGSSYDVRKTHGFTRWLAAGPK
jgi:hypothetical protein